MRKILIVVDMQRDFIDMALGTKEAVAIVDAVKEKIGAWMSRETEEEGKPAKEETEEEQNNP